MVLISLLVGLLLCSVSSVLGATASTNHFPCTDFVFTTSSPFSCLFPNNTLYLPTTVPVIGSSYEPGSSIEVCTEHDVDSVPCTLGGPPTNARAEEVEEIETDEKKLPRYLKGLKKTKQRLRYLPEYLRGTVAADCFSELSYQWHACDSSKKAPTENLGFNTGDLCKDVGLPELARFPSTPQIENITCGSPGCFCFNLPSAAQFGLPDFGGVVVGFVITYIQNPADASYGLSINSTCSNDSCPITTTTTTGVTTGITTGVTTGNTGNNTNGTTALVGTVSSSSSSSDDLALILGLCLGLGIPCLIICCLLLIGAIVAAILLLKGKGASVKTFWVPSRDDL